MKYFLLLFLSHFSILTSYAQWTNAKIPGSTTTTHSRGVWMTAQNTTFLTLNNPNASISYILKASDPSSTFKTVGTFSNVYLNDVVFYNENLGVAVGEFKENFVEKPCVLKTTDGGATWKRIIVDEENNTRLGKCVFISDKIILAASDYPWGYPEIYKSSDAGETWELLYEGKQSDYVPMISHMQFLNAQIGFFSIEYNPSEGNRSYLLKTTDGGKTFSEIRREEYEVDIAGFHFFSATKGLYLNTNGEIYSTENSGTTWTKIRNASSGEYFDIFFVDNNNGFLAESESIYRTTDGGKTWSKVFTYSGFLSEFKEIFVSKDGKGIVTGDFGVMAYTNNALGASTPVKSNFSELSIVHLFPNPAKDKIQLEFLSKEHLTVDIKIRGMQGDVVKVLHQGYQISAGNNLISVNTDIPAGMYMIEISNSQNSSLVKFIKQ